MSGFTQADIRAHALKNNLPMPHGMTTSELPIASIIEGLDGWIHFTVVGQPVPAPRQTRSDKWQKRPCVIQYREFQNRIRAQMPSNLPASPTHAVLSIWMPMPEGWTLKKKAAMKGSPHRQRPDFDNVAKAILDSLWHEDSGIWNCTCRKFWDDGKGPRVEVSCK